MNKYIISLQAEVDGKLMLAEKELPTFPSVVFGIERLL